MLDCVEDGAGRLAAALKLVSRVPLQAGPKWIAWVTSDVAERQRWNGTALPPDTCEQLLQLEPANTLLKYLREDDDGYIATSGTNESGLHRGYARIGPDRTIEMVGVLGVGVWGEASQSWWPGAYEVPMLKMLSTTLRKLLDRSMQGTTPTLFMALTDIDGTAILAEHEGMERPFRLPLGVNQIQFSPVRLDDTPSTRTALTASLNKIREIVGIGSDKPFYL